MNRKTFLGYFTFGFLDQDSQSGPEDLVVTFDSVNVGNTIDIDVNPVNGGSVISISLHAVVTSALSTSRSEECAKFIRDLLKNRKLKYRFLGRDLSGDLPTTFGDLIILPDNKNLSKELIIRGFVHVVPALKGRRPDLAAIQQNYDRVAPQPKTGIFLITRPEDRSLHPSLKSCVIAGNVDIDRYATFGKVDKNSLGILICKHSNKSIDKWSINICFRIKKGNTDGHNILITSTNTNKIVFWMSYDAAKESMVYGTGNTVRGSVQPNYKWQILSYCHEKGGDEVYIDGKSLLQIPSVSEPCDVVIAPSTARQRGMGNGTNTVTNLQYIEYADTRLVATRSTIRNLDYNPKPSYPDLADRFAYANRIDRRGEVGSITGLAVIRVTQGNVLLAQGGETFRVYATTSNGSGRLNVVNKGDSSFQEGCQTAHAIVKLWCRNRPVDPNKFDINLSAGQSGLPIQGNSASAAAAICMISAVSEYFIDSSAAVTGAITLNGNITAVGGIPDKAIVALLDRTVSLLAVPASVATSLRPVFFENPKLYMAHQIIAISHIDQLAQQVLLQREANGNMTSISDRINRSRELIIRGMQFYKSLKFTEAVAVLSQALTYCPEDIVTSLWIDLIKEDYLKIKEKENDF